MYYPFNSDKRVNKIKDLELKDLERETFSDLVRYITCPDNKNRKFVIITMLPFELTRLIREVEPSFSPNQDVNRRYQEFLDGDIRIFASSMFYGYDLGDKVGNDQRELIIFPTFSYRLFMDQQNILARVTRYGNRSAPIITKVFRRDGQVHFASLFPSSVS